ncbi:MAG TPA: glycosyltransferase family 4 protein [Holophagaceae bacterium]
MKVAFLHTAFGALGGAELLAAAQGRLLIEAGHELSLVTFGWAESPWRELFGGAQVTAVPRRHWRDLLVLDRSSKWAPRARRAWPRLRNAEVVVAHGQPLAGLLGERDLPARRLWYCHEAPWRLHPDRVDYTLLKPLPEVPWIGPFRALAAEVRRKAAGASTLRARDLAGTAALDGLAANSDFARRALEAIYDRRDVAVIPPVIAFPEAVPHRQGLRRGGLQVLTLARLGTLKNVEAVIRGFGEYAGRAGSSARLHVVGDGGDRTRLETLTRDLGLSGSVQFHGTLDPVREAARLEALYAACDVFALLPLDESFGMVFPEAAARGLLLIGPDHGGPVEILEDGRFGPCLPVFEPEALAEALQAIDGLTDAEVDRRREATDSACRARYGSPAVLPLLQAWILGNPRTC